MYFKAFPAQRDLLRDKHRIRGAFAGKRGGKTEAGAIATMMALESKPNYKGPESYKAAIIAPTFDMLRRLSMDKFLFYSRPLIRDLNKSRQEVEWHDGSIIYGLSADRPERIEGLKLNFIWLDEALQMKEQMFLECLARTTDTVGHIIVTSSLGVQYNNPKATWCYKFFKEKPLDGTATFEWPTTANPYVSEENLSQLKETLDPRSYRQMFTIDWDTPGSSVVYDDFDDANIRKLIPYDPNLETSVSVDWGWAHPAAATFWQTDGKSVFLIDEIVSSKMTLDVLWDRIKSKGYSIKNYYCDIAGTQEREIVGRSNVAWFREAPRNIHFRYRRTGVNFGISLVRSFIKNKLGQRRFFVCETKCPKSVDGLKNYSYPEKNGIIQNENPIKKDDDAVDSIRYYLVNRHDPKLSEKKTQALSRWGNLNAVR